MKKLLTLLLALPLLASLSACHDDDDLPDVTLNVTYSNAVIADNMLYVVHGDTLQIDSVQATPSKPDGKAVKLLAVAYRLNGWLVANVPFPPFGVKIPTDNLQTGDYSLGIEAPVLQVNKEPATIFAVRKVRIVSDSTEIPGVPDAITRSVGGTFETVASTK